MKKAPSLRTSFLTGCAALALGAASSLQAADAPPSIEIHLDVLSHLSQPQAPAPLMATPAAEPKQEANAHPKHHAKKLASAKHEKKTKEAHWQPKDTEEKTASAKHGKKTKEASAETRHTKKVASAKHAKKTQEAKAESRDHADMEPDGFAPPPGAKAEPKPEATNFAPPPDAKPSVVAQSPTLPPEAPLPSLPSKSVASADVPPPANPLPGAIDTPKLPEADIASKSASSKHDGVMSGITGGMTDLLGGDSDKPSANAAAATPAAKPAAPPLELAPSANADKTLPGAPPLAPGAGSDKPLMASNDLPPTLEKSAPLPPEMQTAQATLTPLPLPGAPGKATASAPMLLPAPAPEPVPAIVAPKAPGAPAAPSSPVPAADSGATPDLRIPFNANETEVPLASNAQLDGVAKKLHDDPNARVSIMAYASGPDTAGIYPKRVSLARGIAVRNYLTTTKGIDIERVNVKALGNKNVGGPGDRVDLFILK